MKKMTIYQIAACAIMAAVLSVLGPLTVPIGPIPISLATFVIYLDVYILGPVYGAVSVVIYLLLGLAGVPVFAGYTSGIAKLAGPTGGFLVGYALIVLVGGFFMKKSGANPLITAVGMAAGTVLTYAVGTVWFVVVMQSTVQAALASCVIPFVLIDLGKIAAATLIGKPVRIALRKAGLLTDERKVRKEKA